MENANELMGILHGAYGLGGAIGPLISTAMVTKGGLHWYTWYYVMVRPLHPLFPNPSRLF
jgi:fucose permease